MDFLSWVQVLTICVLGAMSPGPSLAIVLRNTVKGGKKQGILTGIGHGLGIYFYAALVVTGLSLALAAAPKLELYVSYTGVALLIWLGISFLRSNPEETPELETSSHGSFLSGFLIAFLNPKIAAYFLAVFGSFLRVEASSMEKAILALTAGTVDTLWYVFVAFVLSGSTMSGVLNKYSATIEKAIGGFLLFLATGLIYRAYRNSWAWGCC